jgi:hypothetical protein
MGIEKPTQFSNTPGDRQKLVDLEEVQGHNEYSSTFDSIERNEEKAHAIIAQALLDKAVAERAFSQAMSAAGQDMGEDGVTEEAESAADELLKKLSQKE